MKFRLHNQSYYMSINAILFFEKAAFFCFILIYFILCTSFSNQKDLSITYFISDNLIKFRDFTIIIHSSNITKWRLNKNLKRYIVHKPHIHIFVVYAENATIDPKYNSIIAYGCPDKWISIDCKDAYAYNFFLKNVNLGDFLYRAMDDTFLDILNLEKLIIQLRTIYNPSTDIVFRGVANDEYGKKIYLGGGSGWLMSRAMVALHNIPFYSFSKNTPYAFRNQDDTAETIILKKIGFKKMNVWEDPRWAESGCTAGNFSNFLNENFLQLENCSLNNELISLTEMIALHSATEDQKENWIISRDFPSYIYGYKVPISQCVKICKSHPGIINYRTTYKYLKDNAEIITLSDIKKRKIRSWNYKKNYIEKKSRKYFPFFEN